MKGIWPLPPKGNVVRSGITAITPTGDRPLAFALCERWVSRQTKKPDQWIVVDDGRVPITPSVPMDYVRREPLPTDPKFTLCQNLIAALSKVKGDRILILEDDEYYAPGYVEAMWRALDGYQLAGIMCSKYYHLPSGKYTQIGNKTHASLAETGFRESFLPQFRATLDGDSYLDIRLWKSAPKGQSHLILDSQTPLYIGIKGLPGRAGIGLGHSISLYRASATDTTRSVLKAWAPNDWGVYMDIVNGVLTSENYREYFKWA